MDIPVLHGRGGRVGARGLQGFPGQDSTACGREYHRFPAATAEQIVDIPVPRGRFAGYGTFSSREKRCAVRSAPGVGTGCGLYFIHAGG